MRCGFMARGLPTPLPPDSLTIGTLHVLFQAENKTFVCGFLPQSGITTDLRRLPVALALIVT
jgi:hypothetical protein